MTAERERSWIRDCSVIHHGSCKIRDEKGMLSATRHTLSLMHPLVIISRRDREKVGTSSNESSRVPLLSGHAASIPYCRTASETIVVR